MNNHRNVCSYELEIINTAAPFSSFDFILSRYEGLLSLRRCFSIARPSGFQTITIEKIPSEGIIQDENEEIASFYSGHRCESLQRIAFWKAKFSDETHIKTLTDEHLIGYVILKQDYIPDDFRQTQWHIFESVFRKYYHKHNCVPGTVLHDVRIGKSILQIPGIIYCQQNQLNKACAHVALRTIISNHLKQSDLPYRKMNKLAGITPGSGIFPKDGLGVQEIRKILNGLNIPFFDIDYTKNDSMRHTHPYQKYLYSGLESGAGAMLGFHYDKPELNNQKSSSRHIIPFFGHTFNKDTWVPDAEMSYFNIGGSVGYIPSENWTSSFIGHDDNFGSDFCVPRLYVNPGHADYVIELLHDNVEYSGVKAEVFALYFLYTMQVSIKELNQKNIWLKRFNSYLKSKKIVLRPLFISKNRYLKHLKDSKDWDGNSESPNFLNAISNLLPNNMWMIEVSLVQLFPANERKIGEVLLNPFIIPNSEEQIDLRLLLLARLPSLYCFHTGTFKENHQPDFIYLESQIKSHMPLAKLEKK